MREKMYSKQSNSMLHDHIIDGFHSTHEGLHKLKEEKLISNEEYVSLLEQNIKRLVSRVHEFRIQEKMIDAGKRIMCIFFAILFTWMQTSVDEDLDMRRSSPTRTHSARSVKGSRGGRGGRRDKDL